MRPQQTAPPPATRDAPPPGARSRVDPFEVTLASGPAAPGAARAAVTAWIAGHISHTMLIDAQLLVGELVANSVRHADAPAPAMVRVRARVQDRVLHLEVEDRGSSGVVARREPDLQEGGGFGLNIVDELSRRWGVSRDAGTRVWADLAFAATG
jgi:serine/threonine-protein kinase RsbW